MTEKKRSTKARNAEKLYKKGMKLKDIAEKLEVSETTIRRWKKMYDWKKIGAVQGNKNAVGGNQSAPLKNKNAEKFGFFSKHLPPESVKIIEEMPKNSIDVLWEQIQIAYAAIIRAQKIMYVNNPEQEQAPERHGEFLKSQARAQTTLQSMIRQYEDMLHIDRELIEEEQIAKIERLKADIKRIEADTERIKGGEQVSTEDKVAKLFDAIGDRLDAK